MANNNLKFKAITVIHPHTEESDKIIKKLQEYFFLAEPEHSDLIIVIGGDGRLLHALHNHMNLNLPFYGIHSGNSIGFLMNNVPNNRLLLNIQKAKYTTLYPLKMKAINAKGQEFKAFAINEVSIFRQSNQAAKVKVKVNNVERIKELIADGALVSTAAGSSAYNFSTGGDIIPLGSNVLSLRAISPFRPRRWTGAILPDNVIIEFEVLESDKRPVSAVADFNEFSYIQKVVIKSSKKKSIKLLFNQNHPFEKRVIKEQFSY